MVSDLHHPVPRADMVEGVIPPVRADVDAAHQQLAFVARRKDLLLVDVDRLRTPEIQQVVFVRGHGDPSNGSDRLVQLIFPGVGLVRACHLKVEALFYVYAHVRIGLKPPALDGREKETGLRGGNGAVDTGIDMRGGIDPFHRSQLNG